MEKIEKLMSPRMLMIAQAVNSCKKVFDTGSDHAFIPIYLVLKGICGSAVASDVKEGPIKVSARNIRRFKLENRISVEKGDGIENAAGYDSIIIAGMGGQLICDIISRSSDIAKKAVQLILQPMNAPEKLRKYLWDNGYRIIDENLCSEKHKVYNVICAEYTGKQETYEKWQLHTSKNLVEKKHILLSGYLEPKLRRLYDMRNGISNGSEELNDLIKKLEEIKDGNI
jgi:tRNA (adenine22-N1)-methyltransferase